MKLPVSISDFIEKKIQTKILHNCGRTRWMSRKATRPTATTEKARRRGQKIALRTEIPARMLFKSNSTSLGETVPSDEPDESKRTNDENYKTKDPSARTKFRRQGTPYPRRELRGLADSKMTHRGEDDKQEKQPRPEPGKNGEFQK